FYFNNMDLQYGVYFSLITLALILSLIECQTCSNALCKRRDITRLEDEITEVKDGVRKMSTEMKERNDKLSGELSKMMDHLDARLSIIAGERPSVTKKPSRRKESCTCVDPLLGSSEAHAAKSCLEIIQLRRPVPPSGLYWIALTPDFATRLYCDMVTDGGGFTLVWTFTLTDYNNFASKGNDVTPRPNWDINIFMSPIYTPFVKVPVSTTPPESEDDLGALNFKYWKQIGNADFVVKSNLANWIACTGKGSILEEDKEGPITCKVVKFISTEHPECKDDTPTYVNWSPICGLILQRDGKDYINFDIASSACIPKFDPCAEGSGKRYVKNVDIPRGNVYIR
ncbi:unnamed protein product, partial [Owenia fusiformis]